MRHALALAVLALGLSACSAGTGAGAGAALEPSEYPNAVEVDNGSAEPVMIRYYTKGGGPFTLEEVGANRTRTVVLPSGHVGHVFAESPSGRRYSQEHGLVRIRRVKLPAAR